MRRFSKNSVLSKAVTVVLAVAWVVIFSFSWIAIKPRLSPLMNLGVAWVWPIGLIYSFAVYAAVITASIWLGSLIVSMIIAGRPRLYRGLWVDRLPKI